MSQSESSVRIPPRPTIADTIQLRNIQLTLPAAPEAWHRIGTAQPCTASLRFSYASSVAAAEADDVAQTIDYGKLFRRIQQEIRSLEETKDSGYNLGNCIIGTDKTSLQDMLRGGFGEDVRLFVGIIARCSLQILDETAKSCSISSPAIQGDYAEFDIQLCLPKAILRADGGLSYRSRLALGTVQGNTADVTERCLVLLEEEFEIHAIRCFCILGINPWERVEKQTVHISLKFKGVGCQEWGCKVVQTYQKLILEVADRVEATSFGSVETLASFIARVVTVDFGNDQVTVLVEKPNALAFVDGSGLEITRSSAFYQ